MSLIVDSTGNVDRPVILCEQCQKPIRDSRPGYYVWSDDEPRSAVRFVHRACFSSFEATRGGPGSWNHLDLACLLVYLARGLGIDWDQAEELADCLAGV